MRDPAHAVRTRVGKAIRRLRLQRRLSQEQLAELAGTSAKYIGEIERAQVNVSVDLLAVVADALSIDVAGLFAPVHRRQHSEASRLIALEDLEQIEAIVIKAKGPGVLRPQRGSR